MYTQFYNLENDDSMDFNPKNQYSTVTDESNSNKQPEVYHQFYNNPPTHLVLISEVVSHTLFNLLDPDEFYAMLKDKEYEFKINESEFNQKRKQRITTTTKISLMYKGSLEINNIPTLNFFDQLVLSACMTEYNTGHNLVTPSIIFRTLGGIKDSGPKLKQQIYNSMKKMSELKIRLNAVESAKQLFQVKGSLFTSTQISYIFPAIEVQAVLNGRPCIAFHITEKSVLYSYAECKGHVARLLLTNLTIPKTKQTDITIVMRTYIYSRIMSIKRSKATPTVLPETLMKVCGFNSTPMFRYNLFQQIKTYMGYLVTKQVIGSYKFETSTGEIAKTLKNCKKITFIY